MSVELKIRPDIRYPAEYPVSGFYMGRISGKITIPIP
jgi:hypothetical protein